MESRSMVYLHKNHRGITEILYGCMGRSSWVLSTPILSFLGSPTIKGSVPQRSKQHKQKESFTKDEGSGSFYL